MSKIKIGNIKGPKGDRGETGAVGPKGEQGIQGPVGPAGGVNSVNGMTGDVEVDGRNLFVMKDSEHGYLRDDSDGTVNPDNSFGEITSDYILIKPGETYTFQSWITATGSGLYYMIDYMWFSSNDSSSKIGTKIRFRGGVPGFNHAITTATAPENAKYLRVSARLYVNGKIKVERGSIPTDYTPAPEDVVVRSELDKFFNVPYVDDLLTYAPSLPGQNIVHFARTNANTKNTPYSDKITGAREGTAIIIGGKDYSTILFVPIADSTLYTRVCIAGTYGNWYSLTGTERKISSDEPSDDMEIN